MARLTIANALILVGISLLAVGLLVYLYFTPLYASCDFFPEYSELYEQCLSPLNAINRGLVVGIPLGTASIASGLIMGARQQQPPSPSSSTSSYPKNQK